MVASRHHSLARGRAYAGPGWRYAPGLAPRTGEHPETVSASCGRFQSRPADAGQDRPWHPQGLGQCLACAHLAQSASLNGLFGRRHGGRRTMLRDYTHRRHLRGRIAGNSFLQRPVRAALIRVPCILSWPLCGGAKSASALSTPAFWKCHLERPLLASSPVLQ